MSKKEGLVEDIVEDSEGLHEDDMAHSAGGAPAEGEAVADTFDSIEIFQRLLVAADHEHHRPANKLFFSGVTAGLCLGLSFLARAALGAYVPDASLTMLSSLLYPIGFIFIIMGRYQLYTENTLTPVTLVLTRLISLPSLLRVWALVIGANLIGATIVAYILASTGVLNEAGLRAATHLSEHALSFGWWGLFFKGVFAGWLVAGTVWLYYAVRNDAARILLIYLLMLVTAVADLYHCIAGFSETMFLVFRGGAGLFDVIGTFFLPVLLGNTLGGVLLVAILNYAQASDDRMPAFENDYATLSWRAWLTTARAQTLQNDAS